MTIYGMSDSVGDEVLVELVHGGVVGGVVVSPSTGAHGHDMPQVRSRLSPRHGKAQRQKPSGEFGDTSW